MSNKLVNLGALRNRRIGYLTIADVSGAADKPPLLGVAGAIPIATGGTMLCNPGSGNAGQGNDAGRFTRSRHRVMANAVDVRLVYANLYVQQSIPGEAPGANAITVKASVEIAGGGPFAFTSSSTAYSATPYYALGAVVTYNGSSWRALVAALHNSTPGADATKWAKIIYQQAQFPGANADGSITIPPGRVVVSDPIGYPSAIGETIMVNTLVTPTSAGYYPLGNYVDGTGGYDWLVVAATDYTASAPTAVSASGSGYGPIAVIGTPTPGTSPLVIAGIGDSIMDGTGDSRQENEPGGWFIRATSGRGIPNIRMGRGGDKVTFIGHRGGGSSMRLALATCADAVVVAEGTNDLAAVTTDAGLVTLKAAYISLWQTLADKGLRVWQTTITPQTNSTDTWATTTGQTAKYAAFGPEGASGSYRTQLNDWIRSMPAPLAGFIEMARAVEVYDSASDLYAWHAAWTGDGVHPGTAAHVAMAAIVPSAETLAQSS